MTIQTPVTHNLVQRGPGGALAGTFGVAATIPQLC